MTELTPPVPHEPTRISVDAYFDLVERGVIAEDERVELLEGVIVSMTPSGPRHAAVVGAIGEVLTRAAAGRAAVRIQSTFVIRPLSAPEPDIAVVSGTHLDYWKAHPTGAHLLVEVADTSLPQDRLAKSRIYASAGIPEYWVVDLREGVVEVMRDPDRALALYRDVRRVGREQRLEIAALPGVGIDLAELVPEPDLPEF